METELLTQDEVKRIKEFKALYYELNAKPDTTTQIFQNKVVVKMEDLLQLNDMVNEKLSLHSSEGRFGKSSITVSTSKHRVFTFDEWKLFISQNWKVPEYIESITLVWDFYIVVDGYKNPQRHKLTVKISSGLKPEEVLSLVLSGRVEDIEDIEMQQAPIIAQMDFIESRLGQEFINIVSEWVSSLDKVSNEKNKFVLWLKKHKKMVGYYFNYVLFFIACITALVGFNFVSNYLDVKRVSEITIHGMNFLANYIVISVLVCCIILNRGESVANKIFRKLSDYGEMFIFRITKGDENQYNKIKESDKSKAFSVIFNVIFSLIANVFCGIIASIIFSKL